MNKAIKAFFALLFLILTVSGAFAAEKKNKPEIKAIENYVAVFDFDVRTEDKNISSTLADKVVYEFSMSDKYKVIDRGNMNKILSEQKFQISGCVAQECKVEAGQLLGVGKLVSGSVGKVGKVYYLTLQLIDVRTGEIVKSAEDECRCELEELLGSTRRLAKKLLGEKVEQPRVTSTKTAIIVESKAEAIARAKAEEEKIKAEQIAKAKAEEERIKTEKVTKAKVEEERIRAEIAAKAKAEAEEIERVKVEQVAKAEAIAKAKEIERAKTKADELARQKAALEREKQELTWEKQELERQKALNAERDQLAAERNKFETEKQHLSTSAIDPAMVSLKIVARDSRFEKLASGIVRDTQSGLEWYAGPDENTTWDEAKGWTATLRVDGGGWRMPTITELKGLYQKGVGSRNMTPLLETTGWWIWSGDSQGSYGWAIDFDDSREWFGNIVAGSRGLYAYKRGFAVRSRR